MGNSVGTLKTLKGCSGEDGRQVLVLGSLLGPS